MDWQGRAMMGPGGNPVIRPGMMNPQMMRPQMMRPENMGAIQELSHRVNDIDQRLTLTEHANRAALDEVYGLRDSIRNEVNGTNDLQKQVRANGDCVAGVNVRLRGCEERIDDLLRKSDDFQSGLNRLEGQYLRNEGDKRLGNLSSGIFK